MRSSVDRCAIKPINIGHKIFWCIREERLERPCAFPIPPGQVRRDLFRRPLSADACLITARWSECGGHVLKCRVRLCQVGLSSYPLLHSIVSNHSNGI